MRMHNIHHSACLWAFVGGCVYLVGVTVMTGCCHQSQRSHGEGEWVCRLLMEGRRALSLTMSGRRLSVFSLAWGVCVFLLVGTLVLLCQSLHCWEVCVCVRVCYDYTSWHCAHPQIYSISYHTSIFGWIPVTWVLLIYHNIFKVSEYIILRFEAPCCIGIKAQIHISHTNHTVIFFF